MVTVAHLVKKMVDERPILAEAMKEGILSYGALAEKLKKPIEKELGKQAKLSAIVMALRRYSEHVQGTAAKKTSMLFGSEIVMKSGIVDISVTKSGTLPAKLEKLYKIVDFAKGDVLNLIHLSKFWIRCQQVVYTAHALYHFAGNA